ERALGAHNTLVVTVPTWGLPVAAHAGLPVAAHAGLPVALNAGLPVAPHATGRGVGVAPLLRDHKLLAVVDAEREDGDVLPITVLRVDRDLPRGAAETRCLPELALDRGEVEALRCVDG